MQNVHKHFYISEVHVENMKPSLEATSVSMKLIGIPTVHHVHAATCVPTTRTAVRTPSIL